MSESSEIEAPAPADSFWEVAQFKVKSFLYKKSIRQNLVTFMAFHRIDFEQESYCLQKALQKSSILMSIQV